MKAKTTESPIKNPIIELIRPPFTYCKKIRFPRIDVPIGILYIASFLEKNGHRVRVFDSLIAGEKIRMTTSGGIAHLGISWENVKKEIEKTKPDIIGITNQFTEQFDDAIKLAEIAKSVDRKIITVVGGNHCSMSPKDFLFSGSPIDIVAMGEGEKVFLDVVEYAAGRKKLKDVLGIAYEKGGIIKQNERREYIKNLDELPFPAYHLVDMEKYFAAAKDGYVTRPDQSAESERQMSMITSRGCPFNCVFCSIHGHMGRVWRAHSPENVVEHLKFVTKKYGIKHIHFEDDNMTLDSERMMKILEGMEKNRIDITWDTPNGVRLDTLNRNIVRKMKKLGCNGLKIAIESGDQKTLDEIIDKKQDLKKAVEISKICKEEGMPLASFYIIGFPEEKKENIERTLSFAENLFKAYRVRPHFGVAMPLKGTRLYKICKEKNYLINKLYSKDKEINVFGDAVIRTEDFDPEDLKNYIRRFYRRILAFQLISTFTSPMSILVSLKSFIKNPKLTINILKAGKDYI